MKVTVFDHTECGRCSGKGLITAFSHVLGGVCFSCKGTGFHLTRHGKADRARWLKARDEVCLRTVADVQVGDHVRLPSDNKYAIVKALTVQTGPSGISHMNQATGEWIADETPRVSLQYDRKVMDLALASCPSVPRDMVYRDGVNINATAEIYIHPDSPLRNPVRDETDDSGKTPKRPLVARMPRPADFVTPVRRRKVKAAE